MDHSGWLSRSRRTTAILPTDIVVFIVGPTGSGKSWFMSTLLQHANVHVRVNKAQRPGTTEVHAERCIFDGTQSDIVIVDTPSFCTYTDPDGEEVMREWMDSNYTGRCKAVMMVYMHNLAFNPEDANMRLSNHLGVFRRACRQNLFPSVIHVVPTLSYWARLSDTRVKILTAQLQRQANAEGARLASGGRLFDGEPETAWDVVQGFLNETTPCCNAESSVTMRRMGSFDLFHGSEEAVSISSRRQENDESAQPKKPEVARREPEVAPFMPNPSLPFPPNFAAHEESPVVVHSMDLFDWFRGSERTTAILPTDIAVFIVGPAGSGKNWFMSILLQSADVHFKVGRGQTEVHAERCRFDGMQSDIVIVDTPTFGSYWDPDDGEDVMRMWMESNYTMPCKWAGMLYVHNLAFDPDQAYLRLSNNLGAFRRTCHPNLFPSVIHVVPTLSDGARLPDEMLGPLATQLRRQADAAGVLLHYMSDGKPFDGKPETAWDVVQGLLNETTPCTRCYAESSVNVRHTGSSNLSRGSEKAMSISSRRQENDESAQPKKREVAENDYVIFVVGPTGAGKTRFTRQLSKSRYVTQGGHLHTQNVEAWRCNLDDGPAGIMVIDTPSFYTARDTVDVGNTITDWLKSNFTEKCHPGILFLHSLDSDPTCDDTLMSRHLETFAKAFPSEFKVPSRVYVVPTSNSNSTIPSEKQGQRLLQLNTMMEALNGHGNCTWHASMFPGVFKGQPETAWSAALLLLKGISQIQAKESIFPLIGPVLKFLAPKFLDALALKDLADFLFREFRMNSRNGNLDAIITIGRTAMEFTPPEHPQHHLSLINLADLLSERFNKEWAKEDLDEVITLKRNASECMSPGDKQRGAIHLKLDESLSQRFRSGGALADLEEIISLRRIVSESTPARDRCKPLLNLADSLHEKYQKLGSVDDIEEAIRLVHTASQFCPAAHPGLALSQEHLARYLKAKIRKGTAPARVGGLETDPSSSGSSVIEQLIEKVVFETLENMPPRLLHTQSGELCNRDAQLSKFKNSPQYKRLLSSPNNQQLEAEIKAVVSECFGYATLSHRWGSGEPLLRDVEGKNIYDLRPTHGLEKHSLEKLQNFCVRALERKFQWAWSDTCCINKDSSTELQEAIGSMFSWYHRSSLTIVYLADVARTGSLVNSDWFKRGWTLQELLASNTVLFYAPDWSLYVNGDVANHKTDAAILEELCKATQISERHLRNFRPGMEDARSRLCWASHRRTTRPEDVAYSLFGIFEVHLPVMYGETAQNALGRLLEVIISRSGDVSVLDWAGKQSSFNSCFPTDLGQYQIVPHIQLNPSDLVRGEGLDFDMAQKLYADLARLARARSVDRKITLPSIIHPVMTVTVQASSAGPPRYTYQIHASRLKPLKFTSSVKLDEGAGKYILVRPWHPRSLRPWNGSDDDAIWNLLEQLEQPFNALLLERLLYNEYRRIACDCTITARVQDQASILDSEVQTLEVV